MLAMLPIIRRCSPSGEPDRALGARTQRRREAQLLHRVLISSRLAEELRGEVTNKSVPLNQEERCVCACVCTLLISVCSCVHPLLPPSLQNRGLSPVPVCIEELPTPPCLILTAAAPPQQQLVGSHGAIQLPLPSCCASAGHLSGMDTGAE